MDFSLALPTVTLAAGGVAILLALTIVRENPRQKLNWVLGSMLLFGSVGAAFGAIDFAISREEPKLLQGQIGFLRSFASLWEFIFPSFLLFALLFPRERGAIRRFSFLQWLIYFPYIAHLGLALVGPPSEGGGVFDLLTSTLPTIDRLLRLLSVGIVLAYTLNAEFFSLVNLVYMVLAIGLLRGVLRAAANPRLRAQLRVMLAGIGGCFGLYAFAVPVPRLFGVELDPVIRTGLVVAALAIASLSIAYAIVRYRFLDAKIIARRSILFGAASGVLLAVYVTIIHRIHVVVAGFLQVDERVIQTAFLVVGLLVFQPIAGRLEEWIEGLLIRDRGDYRTVLRQLAREVSTVLELDELGERVVRMLETSLMVDRAGLLLRRGPEAPLDLAASFGMGAKVAAAGGADGEGGAAGGADGEGGAAGGADGEGGAGAGAAGGAGTAADLVAWAVELERGDWSRAELQRVDGALAGTGAALPQRLASLLAVPLIHRGDLLGVLLIGSKLTGGGFHAEDRALLGALGDQLGVAIRSALLHRESIARRVLEEELRFARRVQQSFLPSTLPEYPPLEVSALNVPSKQVGGDYVDAVPVGDHEIMVAIGDVSGKGVPAALLMSMTRAALRTQASHRRSPGEILHAMNALIHESTSSREFVTFFLASIDRQRLTVTYSNGGHDHPLLRRGDGSIERLGRGGMLLGAVAEASFEEGRLSLGPGDLLVMYTDGLTEARRNGDGDGEMFGTARLERTVRELDPGLSAREVRDRLAGTCRSWTGTGELGDDMTLLVMRVADGAGPPAPARRASPGAAAAPPARAVAPGASLAPGRQPAAEAPGPVAGRRGVSYDADSGPGREEAREPNGGRR